MAETRIFCYICEDNIICECNGVINKSAECASRDIYPISGLISYDILDGKLVKPDVIKAGHLCSKSCSTHVIILNIIIAKMDNPDIKMHTDTLYMCVVCGSRKPMQCGGCRQISYCSIECQKMDRPLHRKYCSLFSEHKAIKQIEFKPEMIDIELQSLYASAVIDDRNIPKPLEMTKELIDNYLASLPMMRSSSFFGMFDISEFAYAKYFDEIIKRQGNGTLWVYGYDVQIGRPHSTPIDATHRASYNALWNHIYTKWPRIIRSLWYAVYENNLDYVVSHYYTIPKTNKKSNIINNLPIYIGIVISKQYTNTFFMYFTSIENGLYDRVYSLNNAYVWDIAGNSLSFDFDLKRDHKIISIDWDSGNPQQIIT